MLRVGSEQVTEEYFQHDPPTPYQLEGAIDPIEEEVVGTRPMPAEDSTPVTDVATWALGKTRHEAHPLDQ